MVSDVTVTGAVQDAQKTAQQGVKLAEDFNQFLVLLTTQLQNQDPMNPMDSSEFTNQLVQFSQVEQSINTNQKLDDLVSLQLGSVSSFALGYVGLDVRYISSEMNFEGEPIEVSYAMDGEAIEAKINIRDEAGNLVYTETIPHSTGSHEFEWDGTHLGGGTVEPGTYSVSIDALDYEGEAVETTTVVSGNVRGIESQDGRIFLLIGDRAVPLGQVINATQPKADIAEAPAEEDETVTEEEDA